MKNTRITKELFKKCLESKRIPRKLKKSMKLISYSIGMYTDYEGTLGLYATSLSVFGAIELLKDIKRASTQIKQLIHEQKKQLMLEHKQNLMSYRKQRAIEVLSEY